MKTHRYIIRTQVYLESRRSGARVERKLGRDRRDEGRRRQPEAVGGDGLDQDVEQAAPLLFAGGRHRQQPLDEAGAGLTLGAEAALAPEHGRSERPPSLSIVGETPATE